MYAVVETGSKQYHVAVGDTLEVELLDAAKGAEVTADVLDTKKGEKVIAYKMRRTEGYHRTIGHRQTRLVVKIKNIQA
jgi:large subunit ribosomal protein L21